MATGYGKIHSILLTTNRKVPRNNMFTTDGDVDESSMVVSSRGDKTVASIPGENRSDIFDDNEAFASMSPNI
jgi:hypothetical protein